MFFHFFAGVRVNKQTSTFWALTAVIKKLESFNNSRTALKSLDSELFAQIKQGVTIENYLKTKNGYSAQGTFLSNLSGVFTGLFKQYFTAAQRTVLFGPGMEKG